MKMAWRFGGHSLGSSRDETPETSDGSGKDVESLLVFGYSCTLYRDNERAALVDHGDHLIPWMGDEGLRIDRYDCRLLFHDRSQFDQPTSSPTSAFSEEDFLEEQMCDFERYQDLAEDTADQELHIEEGLKRTGRGAEFFYSYDGEEDNGDASSSVSKDETGVADGEEHEEEKVPYTPSPELKVPVGMEVPSTVKENIIIERTAMFVAQQGTQMEIIIKAKQKSNRNFAFLDWDHHLNSYYKHVLKMIKERKYQPKLQEQKSKARQSLVSYGSDRGSESDSDSEGNYYLHPSLLSGRMKDTISENISATNSPRDATTPNIQTSYKLGEENDVYSALYKKLSALIPKRDSQHCPEDYQSVAGGYPQQHSLVSSSSAPQLDSSISCGPSQSYAEWYQWFYGLLPQYPHQPPVIPPPPDLQPVVDKTAEFVARFGPQAEEHLRQRTELQLDFLQSTHPYYSYYQMKVRWIQYEDQVGSYSGENQPNQNQSKEHPSSASTTPDSSVTVNDKTASSLVPYEAETTKPASSRLASSTSLKFAPLATSVQVPPVGTVILKREGPTKIETAVEPSTAPKRKRRLFHDGPIPPNAEDTEVPKKQLCGPISFAIKEKQEVTVLPQSSALETEETESETEDDGGGGPEDEKNTGGKPSAEQTQEIRKTASAPVFQQTVEEVTVSAVSVSSASDFPGSGKEENENGSPERPIFTLGSQESGKIKKQKEDKGLSLIQEERRRKVQMFLNKMKAKREHKLSFPDETSHPVVDITEDTESERKESEEADDRNVTGVSKSSSTSSSSSGSSSSSSGAQASSRSESDEETKSSQEKTVTSEDKRKHSKRKRSSEKNTRSRRNGDRKSMGLPSSYTKSDSKYNRQREHRNDKKRRRYRSPRYERSRYR